VPKKGGGLYWANDQNDKRDYQLGYDSNKEEQNKIADKILTELNMPKTEEAKLKLKKTGLFDITEYGRAVHAEMEALLACARIGVSSCGGTLYSTTFPCHNCAKHIVASGIKRVVFIEPYPKSKALELHGDAISFDTKYKQKATKVVFQPFIGVGPRRFIDLFSLQMSNGISVVRKKTDRKISWCERDAIFRFPLLGFSYLEKEISIGADRIGFEGKHFMKQIHSMKLGMKKVKAKLSLIKKPILLIHSKGDKSAPFENLNYIKQHVSSSQVEDMILDLRKWDHDRHLLTLYQTTREPVRNRLELFLNYQTEHDSGTGEVPEPKGMGIE